MIHCETLNKSVHRDPLATGMCGHTAPARSAAAEPSRSPMAAQIGPRKVRARGQSFVRASLSGEMVCIDVEEETSMLGGSR